MFRSPAKPAGRNRREELFVTERGGEYSFPLVHATDPARSARSVEESFRACSVYAGCAERYRRNSRNFKVLAAVRMPPRYRSIDRTDGRTNATNLWKASQLRGGQARRSLEGEEQARAGVQWSEMRLLHSRCFRNSRNSPEEDVARYFLFLCTAGPSAESPTESKVYRCGRSEIRERQKERAAHTSRRNFTFAQLTPARAIR